MADALTLCTVQLLIVVVYKPPNVWGLHGMDELLSELMPLYDHTIVMGNFKIDVLNEACPQTSMLKITTFNLKQLETEPTQLFHNTDTPTLIDYICCVTVCCFPKFKDP